MARTLLSYLWSALRICALAVVGIVLARLLFGPADEAIANGEHRAAIAAETNGEWFAAIALYEAALAKAPKDRRVLQGLTKLHAQLNHVLPTALYECALLDAVGRPAEDSAAKLAAAVTALFRMADRYYGEAIELAKRAPGRARAQATQIAAERKTSIQTFVPEAADANRRSCAEILAAGPVALACAGVVDRACGKFDLRDPELVAPELVADALRSLAPADASASLAKLAAKLAATAAYLKARAAD